MKAMCQDTTPILGCSAVYCGKHSQNRKIDSHWALKHIKGVRNGGVKVKTPPLSLIFYKNFTICAKEINCFRILLLVNLST